MRSSKRTWDVLPLLAAAVVATAGAASQATPCDPDAGRCTTRTRAGAQADVALRRDELRARFERFASGTAAGGDARARTEWWRSTASRPAAGAVR